MASIRQIKNRYHAEIKKKGIELRETFANKQDAELWTLYKEDLIDQIDAFDPPLHEMITLQDAIELKIKDSIEKKKKDMGDFKILSEVFQKFCSRKIHTITFEELIAYFDELMKIPIRQGGSKNDKSTGIMRMPSMHTTFRKFSYLSTVFQLMKEQGVNIDNPVYKVLQFMRPKLPKGEK